MKKLANRDDRRDFGRRHTVMHAWAFPKGRDRVPCTVRNISSTGALLEFASGSPPFDSFRLAIPVLRQEWWCDVRDRRPNHLGVHFDYMDRILAPSASPRMKGTFRDLHQLGRKVHGITMRM